MKKLYIIIALFSISFLSSQTIFFSEYAEGSSNNKYMEIYNPTNATIDLSGYAWANVSNDQGTPETHEYWNNFPTGAEIASGDVYIIAHPSADDYITGVADHTTTYFFNGDDAYALVQGTESSYSVLDVVGMDFTKNSYQKGPWDVAGVTNGTQNHTLVRKASVTTGNAGDWTASAGTDASDSEWIVLASDDWSYYNAPGETLTNSKFDGVDIAVYPNPVKTKLNFSGLTSPVQATVFDMLGKRLLQSEVINNLDVSSLKSGLYMVEIKNENSAKVFNILKK